MELSVSGPRLFRPWAEYIIGCRLVKLVRRLRVRGFGDPTAKLNKQDLTPGEKIILALDTSSKATCLAVGRGARLLGSIDRPPDEKRSESLWSDVQSLLADLGLTINDIEVFAVCVGPGGFTGLRIGIAAVKGFSAATNRPVIAVTSLEATAFAAGPASFVCAMVNAYKGEVYSQLFSFDGDGVPVAQNTPLVSSFEEALDSVADMNEVVFAGDGVEAGIQVIRNFGENRSNRKWAIKQSEHGLAADVAGLAFLKNARGEAKNAESVRACYVRPAEAEIKLSLGLLGSKIKRSMKSE